MTDRFKENGTFYERDKKKPFTIKYQSNTSSTCYVKNANGHYKYPVVYDGKDVARMFVTLVERLSIVIQRTYGIEVPWRPLTYNQS